MFGSILFGRVLKTPLRFDLSALVLAILFVIFYGLSFGLIMFTVVMVSVLLHELGHAFAADKLGYRNICITLWLLGGMLEAEIPENGKDEIIVAAAGPLVSLVLGAGFYAGFILYPNQLLLVGAFVNLSIGIFNLIPAFPLDGGRILRGAINWIKQDRLQATNWAVRVSQCLCLALGVLALYKLWFFVALILYFIWQAGKHEKSSVKTEEELKKKVEDCERETKKKLNLG